ncbi:MAG: PEP-CTERM-box response regulator transcription factor [Burkholderiales bacterium]|nr:PEP-CTERM-box response regulator transcription factor [Burkholderiales bacterium]
MKPAKDILLLVEDDLGIQKQVKWSLDEYDVQVAKDRESALSQIRRHEPAVVILDLGLPPDPDGAKEGLDTLEQILMLAPSTKVIVVTGTQDMDNAVRAIGLGAYDFYQKPFEAEMLSLIVGRALKLHRLEQENYRLRQQKQMETPMQGIITSDPQMLKVCRTVERVAQSDATMLILGESGTGKELIARALHQLSSRAEKRMVAINCAAIPENLLESELFGFEKGAFTGASKQTIGKIEYASGGTLFLDEIGDLPFSLQAKLLRFLQERVIERLGGRGEIPVDVRVVCATHQNLQELIRQGKFREDLYYRLSEITVNIPPLRNREGDAALLAHALLDRYARQQKRSIKGFAPDAMEAIESFEWPGNVRQMENVIKRAVIMSEGSQITLEDLSLGNALREAGPINLRQIREEAEKKAVIRALGRTNGNVSHAAELLGVSRAALYHLLDRFDLK